MHWLYPNWIAHYRFEAEAVASRVLVDQPVKRETGRADVGPVPWVIPEVQPALASLGLDAALRQKGKPALPAAVSSLGPVVTIRRYGEGDAGAVWRLHRAGLASVDADAGDGPWDDHLRAIETSYLDGRGEFLVAESEGQLVAMGALRGISETRGEIKRMRVDPSHQRQRLGATLLEALEQRAEELGYRMLTLDTMLTQVAARRMYEAHGYREVARDTEMVFYEKRLA